MGFQQREGISFFNIIMEQVIDISNPDGSANKVYIYGPESSDSVFIIFPAMGVWGSYYSLLAGRMGKSGLIACTTDLRGNGDSSVRPSKKLDFGYTEMLEQDYSSTINAVRDIFPNKKIYLAGHSLGGQLACLYTAKNPEHISGLVLIATCSVYYKCWKGFKMPFAWLMTQSFGLLANIMGYFPGKKIGFGGTEARGVISDWSRQSRTGNYILSQNRINYEPDLRKLNIPILSISILGDGYAPVEAVKHLNNKLGPKENIRHIHLDGSLAGTETYGHFNWTKSPDPIIDLIREWLQS